jgi:hypothetical protein
MAPVGHPHAPAVQTSDIAHAWPQSPQFIVSVDTLASHPFAALRSQSWKPGMHDVMAHVPIMHPPMAFTGLQGIMHPPQLVALEFVSASQPSVFVWLQSANPGLHAIEQTPPVHDAVPFVFPHTVTHEPQWFTSLVVAMHVVEQHENPDGQLCVGSQPATQLPPVHTLPRLQSKSERQPVHR